MQRGVFMENIELVIVSGMSGAGKTVAVQSLEDLGYFCIDNMPPRLLTGFWELVKQTGNIKRIALVVDVRTREFFNEVIETVDDVDNTRILFLESSDSVLVSRYKETRRQHPLARGGVTLTQAIAQERFLLSDLKRRSQSVIDTSEISPRTLRERIIAEFSAADSQLFQVNVMSFGFKYGLPIESDIVMDVRFLPNPHYVSELRPQTGLDKPVYDYVMEQEQTQLFFEKLKDLIQFTLPGYKKEGKTNIVIAIGCTGGQHRSVALAERLGKTLLTDGYDVQMTHRDINKRKETVNRS
ncbi:RNase adapter RapZ [Carnobacteriaceae bacterium zg-ZUI252]|nr:RNase adapter RapZ [Carnobacteriaceae bacterium zg-ZUI252]MBS4770185.1 RNase adapter RapZ [Carnobacteriaceae bacterium zg-ZUI240]QTU82777.1 RNase adapter RapZ [Carnobacteriaceae bacterium zg-C25]